MPPPAGIAEGASLINLTVYSQALPVVWLHALEQPQTSRVDGLGPKSWGTKTGRSPCCLPLLCCRSMCAACVRLHTPQAPSRALLLRVCVFARRMMPGLLEGQEKMSKSDPNSAIFMEDSEAEVNSKIKKAFCPPQVGLRAPRRRACPAARCIAHSASSYLYVCAWGAVAGPGNECRQTRDPKKDAC